MKDIAYIGLGSNLNNPQTQVMDAIVHLSKAEHTTVEKMSSLYESKPLGPQDQANFINAVAKISTSLSPFQLLEFTQSIEHAQGRIKTEHWGPRVIDLDILLYGNSSMYTNDLIIPHPGLIERAFVLEPLLELEPEIQLPDGTTAAVLYKKLQQVNLRKIAHE